MGRFVYRCLLVAGLGLLLSGGLLRADEDKASEQAALLAALIHNDMFYGSDDYFGDHRDLAYADRVEPTEETKQAESKPAESTPSGGAPQVDSGGDSGNDGTRADNGEDGGDDDTPAEPPDNGTPPDDDTDDDIGDDVGDDIGDDVGGEDGGGG